MLAADVKRQARLGGSDRVIEDGDHVVWAAAGLARGGYDAFALVASLTIPEGPLADDYEGWRGDWAAFVGGAPAGGTMDQTLRYVRANGEKLTETQARTFFDIEDIPYRP